MLLGQIIFLKSNVISHHVLGCYVSRISNAHVYDSKIQKLNWLWNSGTIKATALKLFERYLFPNNNGDMGSWIGLKNQKMKPVHILE